MFSTSDWVFSALTDTEIVISSMLVKVILDQESAQEKNVFLGWMAGYRDTLMVVQA